MSDDNDRDKILELILKQLEGVSQGVQKVDDKVDDVDKKVIAINIEQTSIHEQHTRMNNILDQNTTSLQEHIQRTKMLEDKSDNHEVRIVPLEADLQERTIASKLWHKYGKNTVIFIGVISTLLGIAVGISKLI